MRSKLSSFCITATAFFISHSPGKIQCTCPLFLFHHFFQGVCTIKSPYFNILTGSTGHSNNKMHAAKTTLFKPYKERPPAFLILFHAFRSTDDLTAALFIDLYSILYCSHTVHDFFRRVYHRIFFANT